MPNQEDYIVEAALDSDKGSLSLTERHRSRIKMYIAIVAIVLVNFIVLYCVRRRMKRELNSELNNRV